MWQQIIPMLKKNTTKLTPSENDEIFLKDMRTALKKIYDKDRDGVHVSDITGCLRKHVLGYLDKDYEITEDQLLYYTTGAAVHQVKQDLAKTLDPEKYTVEKATNYKEGILEAHIDVYNNVDKFPIEMKTARMTADQLIRYGANSSYLLQLAMYLVLTGSNDGLLEYILLSQKNESYYHGFVLTLSEEERNIIKKEAITRARMVQLAKEVENADLVDMVAEDPEFNFMCKGCPYADEIRCPKGYKTKLEMIRNQEEKKQWNKKSKK